MVSFFVSVVFCNMGVERQLESQSGPRYCGLTLGAIPLAGILFTPLHSTVKNGGRVSTEAKKEAPGGIPLRVLY
tara:strand:- start:148 stop:369 length:222 start_codon:yes stop_codon:yes gene_type:complete